MQASTFECAQQNEKMCFDNAGYMYKAYPGNCLAPILVTPDAKTPVLAVLIPLMPEMAAR